MIKIVCVEERKIKWASNFFYKTDTINNSYGTANHIKIKADNYSVI